MRKFIARMPLPITALALAWVLLGNIFKGLIPFLSDMCMIVALILLILTIAKMFLNPVSFYTSIKSPVGLSLFSSFPMSLIMISVWMKELFDKANLYFWVAGVIIQTVILIIFTIKYVFNFRIKYVFPSWFMVYAGLGMSAITCKDFGMDIYGKAVYYYTIFVSIVLILPILTRFFKRDTTIAARPLIALISMPLAIILPAYIGLSSGIYANSLWIMFFAIQATLVFVIVNMIIHLFDGFFPTWSCYAVAVAMIAYASKFFLSYLIGHKMGYDIITYIIYGEYVLSFIIGAFMLLASFISILEDPEVHKQRVLENTQKLNLHELQKKLKKNEKRKNRDRKKDSHTEVPDKDTKKDPDDKSYNLEDLID